MKKIKSHKRSKWLVPFSLCLTLLLGVQSCSEEEVFIEEIVAEEDFTVTNAVGDLVNISNPGFENNWSGWNDDEPSAISGDENSGSKSAKITGSGGRFDQTVSVSSNTNYTLSAYVKGRWRIGVEYGNERDTRSGNVSDWTQQTVTFNSGSSTSVTLLGEYNGGTGRFDDFELVEGTSTGGGGANTNLAIGGSATQSSTSHGGVAARAIDGNTNGSYSNGSVTHTTSSQSNHWWQLDTGSSNRNIGQIVIYNRTDSCCTSRLSNFTVLVRNTSNNTVWSRNISSLSGSSITLNTGGVSGDKVRIEKNSPGSALSLAEVQVFGEDDDDDDDDNDGDDDDDDDSNDGGDTSAYSRIQAEDFDGQNGIQLSNGGQAVGYINTGDWIRFDDVAFGNGAASVAARVSKGNGGTGTIQFRRGSPTGNIMGEMSFGNTGGWTSFEQESTSISNSSGTHDLYLVFIGGLDIDWLEFSSDESNDGNGDDDDDDDDNNGGGDISAYSRIQAEDFDSHNGIQLSNGGQAVGYIDTGDWIRFDDVAFGSGANSVTARVSKGSGGTGRIQFRRGSPTGNLMGEMSFGNTGGWTSFEQESTSISNSSGTHDLYLVFIGGLDVDWFEFSTDETNDGAGDDNDDDNDDDADDDDNDDDDNGGSGSAAAIIGGMNTHWKLNGFSGSLNVGSGSYGKDGSNGLDYEDRASVSDNNNWFFDTNGYASFKCHVGNPTSSGSGNMRSELRELDGDGDEWEWDGTNNTNHRMRYKVQVRQLPSSGKLCFGQIHGTGDFDDVIRVQLEDPNANRGANNGAGSGTFNVTIKGYVTEVLDPDIRNNVWATMQMDQEYDVEIAMRNEIVTVKLNGTTIFTSDEVDSDENYFKAGAYLQSSQSNKSPQLRRHNNNFGEVWIKNMIINH